METKEIKQEDFKSGIDFDSINFSNSEFNERHPGLSYIPKQVALVFSNYEVRVRFLRMYFQHFGIDVSRIDDSQLMVIVKTVSRMECVSSYMNGYNDCMTTFKDRPSFHDRLVEFFNGVWPRKWKMTLAFHGRTSSQKKAKSDSERHIICLSIHFNI